MRAQERSSRETFAETGISRGTAQRALHSSPRKPALPKNPARVEPLATDRRRHAQKSRLSLGQNLMIFQRLEEHKKLFGVAACGWMMHGVWCRDSLTTTTTTSGYADYTSNTRLGCSSYSFAAGNLLTTFPFASSSFSCGMPSGVTSRTRRSRPAVSFRRNATDLSPALVQDRRAGAAAHAP